MVYVPSIWQVRKKGGHLSFAQEPRDRPRTQLISFRIQVCISEFLPYILHTKVSTCNCAYGRWLQNMWFLMDSCDSATQSQPQVATTNAGNCDYAYHSLSLSLSLSPFMSGQCRDRGFYLKSTPADAYCVSVSVFHFLVCACLGCLPGTWLGPLGSASAGVPRRFLIHTSTPHFTLSL
jgi:hypothetical protein